MTGGQAFVGNLFGADDLNPFDAADAVKLQATANSSWYGRTMTTASELETASSVRSIDLPSAPAGVCPSSTISVMCRMSSVRVMDWLFQLYGN